MGTSWTRERSAAVSEAGEGSDEIGVCRGPRVVGMESKASVLGSRCTLDSSDSCERRAACAARSVASSCAARGLCNSYVCIVHFVICVNVSLARGVKTEHINFVQNPPTRR